MEGSRFFPHFRPRRWCWYVRTGSICPRGWQCTFAHHEGWCLGPGAWHPLDPSWVPLPVPGQVKYSGSTGSGAWHPLTPLRGAIPWCAVPQIMEEVEVIQHVPTAEEQIVVCQCHRSCRYVEVASLCGVLPQVQFLDKAVDTPVASNDSCLGLSVQKTMDPAVAVLTLWLMSLLCRSSSGSLAGGASNSVHRQSSWTFHCAQRQGAFSEGFVVMWELAFFALFRVVPELSASFRSPR